MKTDTAYRQTLLGCVTKEQLHLLLQELNGRERKAIYLRFWVPCSIAEVAGHFNISWDDADKLIERSLSKIKKRFETEKVRVAS